MRRPPNVPFMDRPTAFTVGLKPLPLNAWLTPDWEADTLPRKRFLLARNPTETTGTLSGSEVAQAEAAALVSQAVNAAADQGAPSNSADATTLAAAAHRISDDLIVMEQRAGAWTATAVSLCAPTFFSLKDALGSDLSRLHAPVPAGEGFAARIARVFSAIRPDQPLERFNWTVQATAARFTPRSKPLKAAAATAAPTIALDLLHLRVERQTIRKLPQTGAVLFTIRVSLDPLRAVFAVPGARQAFEDAWRTAPAELRAYKGWPAYESLVEAGLDAG